MGWYRGSAAGLETISKALYDLHGYDVVAQNTMPVDHQGYLHWTEADFWIPIGKLLN